jgi:LacI family transcriptional regulator
MLDPDYPFFSALLRGVLAGCREQKKNLLLYGQPGSSSEDDVPLEVLNGLLDGLVLYAWGPDDLTQRLVESHLPVVTVADEVPGLPCVVVDDEMGGRLLVRYLVQKGYQRALYWCASEPATSSVARRQTSYFKEASHCGLNLEVFDEQTPCEPALKTIMTRKNPPDVISAYSDEVAHQIMVALNSLGFQVPRDVAVTGFDGFPGVYPEITTIRAPWKQVAHTAVSLLARNSEGHTIPLQTILPVALQIGETA